MPRRKLPAFRFSHIQVSFVFTIQEFHLYLYVIIFLITMIIFSIYVLPVLALLIGHVKFHLFFFSLKNFSAKIALQFRGFKKLVFYFLSRSSIGHASRWCREKGFLMRNFVDRGHRLKRVRLDAAHAGIVRHAFNACLCCL